MKPSTAVYPGCEQVSSSLNIYHVFVFIIYEALGERAGVGFAEGIGCGELLSPAGRPARAGQHTGAALDLGPSPASLVRRGDSLALWLPPSGGGGGQRGWLGVLSPVPLPAQGAPIPLPLVGREERTSLPAKRPR